MRRTKEKFEMLSEGGASGTGDLGRANGIPGGGLGHGEDGPKTT